MDHLMHKYHNERVAELIRIKDPWLNKVDPWPIKVNQFNQVFEGNHRFRAIRYLELPDVEVVVVQEANPRAHPFGSHYASIPGDRVFRSWRHAN
jgi:hypothetical protein